MDKMNRVIIAYLESHGASNIFFDGAWVSFTGPDGNSSYASRNELYDEWKKGK